MTPTKLLFGQILIVMLTALLGVWAATQWAAIQLGYQAQLGAAWFQVFDVPIYRPWQLFIWWYFFDAYAPVVFARAGMLAAASGLIGCSTAIAGSVWRARQAKSVTTQGSARWATHREIENFGLLRDAGVFLGRWRDGYLRHAGPEHVMAFAPTCSGKGVGLVVPTLLSQTGSVIVHDIKGENWELTAGWRARFSHCLLFNPTDIRSARFNPLLEVRMGPNEVRDVCWLIRKVPSNTVRTGRRPAILFWQVSFSTCSTPKQTRPWLVWRPSCQIRSARSKTRYAG